MQRVMVIGGPGSGKTWLARELSKRTGLPVIAIDDFVHDASGRLRRAEEIDSDACAAADGTRWIVEGGNSRTYAHRAARAHCIVRMRVPVLARLWRIWRRDGWNRGLLIWTWRYDREFGPRDDAATDGAPGETRIVVLRSRRDIDSFLVAFAQPAPPHRPSA